MHCAQLAAASSVDSCAGRVLAPRRGDDGACSAAQRVVELARIEAAAVDRDRLDLEPECMDEIGNPRPTGILDRDPVARPELGLKAALDRVERATCDRDVAPDLVRKKVRLRQRLELGQLGRDAVELVRRVDATENLGEGRQKPRIGIAASQIVNAGR